MTDSLNAVTEAIRYEMEKSSVRGSKYENAAKAAIAAMGRCALNDESRPPASPSEISDNDEILMTRRWLYLNGKHQRDLIVSDPLVADHHRGEVEMFEKALMLLTKLSSSPMPVSVDDVAKKAKVERYTVRYVLEAAGVTHVD